MIRFIVLIFPLLISVDKIEISKVESNKEGKMTEIDSVYLIAINEYIKVMANESALNRNILHIRDDEYLWDLPDSINEFKLEYISSLDHLAKLMKKSKEEVDYIEVSSLYIKEGYFYIHISKSRTTLENRKRLYIGLAEWVIVKYALIEEKLVYQSTEIGGV